MNTRELRIGNIVNVEGVGMVKVNGVTQHKIGYCPKPNYEKYARSRDIEPIRLNGEVLARFSFGESWFINTFVVIQHEDGNVDIMFPVFCRKIIYLHDLQNMYWLLTGKELKIK